MIDPDQSDISRRAFVRRSGLLAGGALLGAATTPQPAIAAAQQELPRRVLGRTKVPITTFTLGTAPMGLSKEIPPPQIAKVVNAALDLGINSIDTAPSYQQAEEGVGLALGRRREEVFLATKVLADTIPEAEKSLSTSLKMLKTEQVDLLYFHNLGGCKIDIARDPDGVFTWLVKQKQAGKCRFLGVSGHNRPGWFPPFLETGEVDVVLVAMNFVDRHTYDFEQKVLPVARKHNLGVVAMKVFGGARQKAGSYANPKCPPELDLEHLESAVRYGLGLPGVTTLNLGVHNAEQVRRNLAMVKQYRPLSADETVALAKLGRELADKWGSHFGPVV